MLLQIKDLSNETDFILQSILLQSALVGNNLFPQDSSIVNLPHQILYSAQTQYFIVLQLLRSVKLAEMQKGYATRKAARINDIVTQLATDVNSLLRATQLAKFEVSQTLRQVNDQVNEVQDMSIEISTSFFATLNTTSIVLGSLNNTQSVSETILYISYC